MTASGKANSFFINGTVLMLAFDRTIGGFGGLGFG